MVYPDAITEIDARGLLCPLPVLRARKVLLSLPQGALLRVLATDTMARIDGLDADNRCGSNPDTATF